jgi:hypothetical protein
MPIDRELLEQQLEIRLERREALAAEKLEKMLSRKGIASSFLEAFELVGGIPRLAMWANDPANYGEFVKLYARFAPKEDREEETRHFTYVSNVPQSPLNKSRQEEAEDAQLIEHHPTDED